MLRSFPDYEVLELRVSTGTHCYWRARRIDDGLDVLIKSRRMGSTKYKAHALSLERARLDRLESPYLPKVLGANLEYEDPFLVFEALASHRPLAGLIEASPLSSAQATELGIHMTRGLLAFHQQGLCCLSLSPDSIWVDEHFSRCVLMDLSSAAEIGRFPPEVAGCFEIDEGLRYIAPEQTGRLNEPLDERSDFYSLGLVIHCALGGKFAYSHHHAPHSLIYAQLCEPPPELPRGGIAPALRGIVGKLCQKSKRRRYQSADGLLFDFKKTQKEIAFNRNLDFPAGQRDRPLRFDPSPILYEREDALCNLRNAIERCAKGEASYVNIAGKAGMGKSRLLRSIMPDLARHQMLFAHGRCQSGIQGRNYGPVAEIIRSLITAGHALPPHLRREQISRSKRALGGTTELIRGIIPEIDGFISPSSDSLGEYLEQERQRACLLAMLRFILSFACHHQPLVLHFDGLQWADFKTTAMIHALLADPSARYLLVIGSLRQQDEFAPMESWGQNLIKSGVPFTSIRLAPLSEDATVRFVTDSLSRHESAKNLALQLHRITRGRPDALSEHLLHLHNQGHFFYDEKDRSWKVKNQALESIAVSSTPARAGILAQRLEQLSQTQIDTLIACALLGTMIRPERLSQALEIDLPSTLARLEALAKMGFLHISLQPWRAKVSTTDPHGEVAVYRFAKDQMRDHVLALPEGPARLRHSICKTLLAQPELATDHALRRGLMRLVYPCLDTLANSEQAEPLKALFYKEAHEAYANTAYQRGEQLANAYFRLSGDSLAPDADERWSLNLKHLLALHLAGNDEGYETLIEHLSTQCTDKERRIDLLHAKILRAASRSEDLKALEHLGELAKLLDEPIASRPSGLATRARVTRWQLWLNQKRIDQLFTGPALRSPTLLRFLEALSICTKSAFITNQPNLYISIINKALEITFHQGLNPAASVFFGHVALMALSKSNDLQGADDLFAWAEQILKVQPHPHYHASVVFLDALYRSAHKSGLTGSRSDLMRAHRLAHEAGDEWTATHCLSQATALSLWIGDHLDTVRERAESSYRYATRTQVDNVSHTLDGLRYNVTRLKEPHLPYRSVSDFAQAGPISFSNRAACLCQDLAFLIHLGELQAAWDVSQQLDDYLTNIEGLVVELVISFYRAIVACHYYQDPDLHAQAHTVLQDARRRLDSWHTRNPKTSRPFVLIIEALYAGEIEGKLRPCEPAEPGEAMQALDHAIFEVESMQKYHLAALGATWGLRWAKRFELGERVSLYAQRVQHYRHLWGASPTLPSDEVHVNLCHVQGAVNKPSPGAAPKNTLSIRGGAKADELIMQCCAIASRLDSPEESLRDFIDLVRDNVMTERVVVMLDASLDIGQGTVFPGTKGLMEVAHRKESATSSHFSFEQRELSPELLPMTLIYRCVDSQEAIFIDCVQESSLYTQDSYFQQEAPSSATMVPIPGQRNAIGVVYLESFTERHEFSKQHVHALGLLTRALGAALIRQSHELRLARKLQSLEEKLSEQNHRLSFADDDRRRVASLLSCAQTQLRSNLDSLTLAVQRSADQEALMPTVHRMNSSINAMDEVGLAGVSVSEEQSQTFALRTLLDRVCARAQSVAKKHGVTLQIHDRLEDASLTVRSDKQRLYRAIGHLLDFAVQESANETLRLNLDLQRDDLENQLFWVTELELPLRAENGGLERILLPSKMGADGGLLRAQQLIAFSGGRLEVDPHPQGVRLRSVVQLELHQEPVLRRAIQLAPRLSSPLEKRALVVQDRHEDAQVLAQLLKLHDIDTCIVHNGLEAVQRFQAQPHRFGLIVLGCDLPVMDGYQAAAHIRSSTPSRSAYIPIFGLSAQDGPAEKDRCLASGMDLHLREPIAVQDLTQALERWGLIEAPANPRPESAEQDPAA